MKEWLHSISAPLCTSHHAGSCRSRSDSKLLSSSARQDHGVEGGGGGCDGGAGGAGDGGGDGGMGGMASQIVGCRGLTHLLRG